MENIMKWFMDNLQILSTLGSALSVYIFIRMGARKEIKGLKEEFKEVKEELKTINKNVQSLDSRISRIEGQLTGMQYHWEPRIIEKKEE